MVRYGADILVAGTFLFQHHGSDLSRGVNVIREAIDAMNDETSK